MENIDLTSFDRAIYSLKEVIDKYKINREDLIVRDSLIKRFEYTYAIALKSLKRFFEKRAFFTENIESLSFNEMIRIANKMNLLKSDLETWTIFRQNRNPTSHTYDEEIAKKITDNIEIFYIEVEYLVGKLKEELKKCSD